MKAKRLKRGVAKMLITETSRLIDEAHAYYVSQGYYFIEGWKENDIDSINESILASFLNLSMEVR